MPVVCDECKHLRWGRAIDRRETRAGYPSPGIRPTTQRGNRICAAHPIEPGAVDSQSGRRALARGEDCRDLNDDGGCVDYVRVGLLTRLFR